jgi:diguanylate cyclase (GGDEF)-like protein
MADEKVTLFFRNNAEAALLRTLTLGLSPALICQSVEEAAALSVQSPPDVFVVDQPLAEYASLKPYVTPRTAVLITGRDENSARDLISGWPPEYYTDFAPYPTDQKTRERYLRALQRALEHVRLKSEVEKLTAQNATQDRVREVYSEIREIKGFINENVVRELEKRVALQVRYLWFQRRKQKIENILRKIYVANDVSSLLDTVYDIKDLVQASGITFYIMDENETLGRYLKPLVWDDAFLSHHEFSRYIALLDTPDFAAQVVRHREDINLTSFSLDKRLSKRYVEHLKNPLRSLLCVPIMHEKEVIGVLEVYNKMVHGDVSQHGFSREDQQVLRGLSEHISLAMTKLNLIQYDALTGLLRPDPFFEKVIQKINQRSKRRQEVASYAVVMGDVDWFKQYNDRNGHEAGNRLLRQLAAVLKSSIREEDLICRYGGEEFLFFLTGVNSLEEACVLTERIRKNVESQYFENEEFQPRNNLTMSFGVTMLPRQEEFFASINRYELRKIAGEADMALAEAKGKRFYGQKGQPEAEPDPAKNKVCVFQREPLERGRGGVIRPFRQEFFEEKRRHERQYISTLLLYQENGHFRVTKTINMSMGGVRIFSDSKLPLAKPLDLFLILENRATPFKGNVVYSQKTADEPAEYHTGIRFREMAAAEKKALEEFLASVSKREAAG